jgi:hypothetical protein
MMVDPVHSSSLVDIPKEHKTDLWLSRISSFGSVVGEYVRLPCILSAVKTGLQSYCDTRYSRGSMDQMWILKNSKDLLKYIQFRSLSSCHSIKTFDLSTLSSTKDNKYVVNQTLEHVDDISFREHFGRIRDGFFWQNKICSFPIDGHHCLNFLFIVTRITSPEFTDLVSFSKKIEKNMRWQPPMSQSFHILLMYLYLRWPFFFMKHNWTNSFMKWCCDNRLNDVL